MKWTLLFSVMSLMPLTLLSSCGKPGGLNESGDGSPTVKGQLALGAQCPYGSVEEPMTLDSKLWDCPMRIQNFEFSAPPPTLYVQGDCRKRLLAIRTLDGTIDTLWKVNVDGTFYITLDGTKFQLANDGAGHANCTVPIRMDFIGRMNCNPAAPDRDKITLQFDDIYWWLGKTNPTPPPQTPASPVPPPPGGGGAPGSPRLMASVLLASPVPIPIPGADSAPGASSPPPSAGAACKLPPGCYLHSSAKLQQCP